MTLSLIAAVGRDGAIGRDGSLAFYIRDDLRHFKALTMGCPVIMGRKTFESLPKGALPGRRNIVISRDPAFSAPDVEVVGSVDAALALVHDAPRVFVIGGGSVYSATIDRADCLEITHIDAVCPGADTFFPVIDPVRWMPVETSVDATDPSGIVYRFVSYRRR